MGRESDSDRSALHLPETILNKQEMPVKPTDRLAIFQLSAARMFSQCKIRLAMLRQSMEDGGEMDLRYLWTTEL